MATTIGNHYQLTWWEVLFGKDTVTEFAPPAIETGDIYEDSEGVQWSVDAKGNCPYPACALPERYRGYGATCTWVFLWRVSNHPEYVLSEWMPERMLIELIERGE